MHPSAGAWQIGSLTYTLCSYDEDDVLCDLSPITPPLVVLVFLEEKKNNPGSDGCWEGQRDRNPIAEG